MSDELGNKNSSDDLKKKILSSMNTTFTGEATQRWITAMKDEAFDEVEESVVPAAATDGPRLNHSMAAVIDRLFDNFKRYSFEYNRTQDDREFEINCERPASMRTTAEYMEMGKPIKFCLGHLASRHFAMVIQGEENRILVYITPVEYLVGFKPSPSDFPPHLEIRLARDTANKSSREFVWTVGGQMLSQDSLPVLARRLFTQLVKVCKGEANYGELFALSPQEERLALAQQVNAPVDRTFEEDNSMLLGQKKAELAEKTFFVAAEQVEQLTAAMASGAYPAQANPAAERPPLNALINPSPLPASISASSSYPQVAAAIANGEPKALAPNNPATPDTAPSFPRTQSVTEQAETFPRLPAPDLSPAMAPARTFVAEPGNHANDEAIAALIFPAPPGQEPAPAGAAADQAPSAPVEPAQADHDQASPPEYHQTSPAEYEQAQPEPEPEPEPAPTPPPAPAAVQAYEEVQAPEPAAIAAPVVAPVAAPVAAPLAASAQAQALQASPWIGPNGEPARMPTPSQTSLEIPPQAKMENNQAHGNNGQSNLDKMAADAKANIAQSLQTLFATVDGAISGLTAVGMTAMHEDDLNTVSAVMKQTKSLKGFRDSVVALSKDWQQASE